MATETGTGEKRSSRPIRKRRKAVVDAAARVFAERGYHGASTQDIADLLGMRQASLYYYFDSKEAALEEVCALGTEGFIETAEKIAKSPASSEERLTQLLTAHVMPLQDRSDYMLTFLNERKWLPIESRRRIGRLSRRLEAIFERVIREGVRSGEFRTEMNPRLATLGLLGMMNAVASWHDQESSSLTRIAESLSRLVLDGAKAAPPDHRKGEQQIL